MFSSAVTTPDLAADFFFLLNDDAMIKLTLLIEMINNKSQYSLLKVADVNFLSIMFIYASF